MFDVFYMGDNPELASRLPFAKQVSDSGNIFSQTKMYWLIEPHVELIDTDVLNYRPEDHDSVYEHIWKWNSNNYGGVRLLPKGESLGVKEVNQIVCKKSFAILNTPDPGDYLLNIPMLIMFGVWILIINWVQTLTGHLVTLSQSIYIVSI